MDKAQYFSILTRLNKICYSLPGPIITGMNAYLEIITYLYLRHVSDNGNIPIEYNLRTLYNNYCLDKHIQEDLLICNSGNEKESYYYKLSEVLLPCMNGLEINKDVAFFKIMSNTFKEQDYEIYNMTSLFFNENIELNGGRKAQKLINKIYKKGFLPTDDNDRFNFNMFPFDAIGEGYEKFMNEYKKTGGNLGQYFTNVQAIEWILNKLDIKNTDKIIDPFAGSGGFIMNALKYGADPNNVYAQELDQNVYKLLKMNSVISGINHRNITKGNTFDFNFLSNNENKYDKILANPPYGLSIDISLNDKEIKEYWDVLGTGKKTIKNSMGLSTYIIYKMLKENGTAGFVCERGILVNGSDGNTWQRKLRKFLLMNSNIKEILLLPTGIFSFTNIATACIIMEKGKKTENIIFHEGYFKEGEDKLYIRENIRKATIQDIINNGWSLNYEDYKKEYTKDEILKECTEDKENEFVRRIVESTKNEKIYKLMSSEYSNELEEVKEIYKLIMKLIKYNKKRVKRSELYSKEKQDNTEELIKNLFSDIDLIVENTLP